MPLPKSIIKKYGVSKKAWAVYRQQKRTTPSTKRTKRLNPMARKRRKKFRSYRRKRSSGMGDLGVILAGMIYGAGREKLNNVVAPITSKIPLGYTADNIVLGGISYLLMKGKIPFLNKIKMSRDIGKAGLIIESALLGQDILKGNVATASSNGRGDSFR